MHHRIVQRVDALEIFSIQGVLRSDPPGGGRTEIGLKQLHHWPDDRETRAVDLLTLRFETRDQIFFQKREQDNSRRLFDLGEDAVELFLAAHQRIDMLDRRDVGILSCHRAGYRYQRLAGRIGHQMEMKVAAGDGHHNPVYPVNLCGA